MHAVTGAGGDAIGDLERRLNEPLPSEMSGEEMDALRRRKTADDNAAAHARLVTLMQMPRKRELA